MAILSRINQFNLREFSHVQVKSLLTRIIEKYLQPEPQPPAFPKSECPPCGAPQRPMPANQPGAHPEVMLSAASLREKLKCLTDQEKLKMRKSLCDTHLTLTIAEIQRILHKEYPVVFFDIPDSSLNDLRCPFCGSRLHRFGHYIREIWQEKRKVFAVIRAVECVNDNDNHDCPGKAIRKRSLQEVMARRKNPYPKADEQATGDQQKETHVPECISASRPAEPQAARISKRYRPANATHAVLPDICALYLPCSPEVVKLVVDIRRLLRLPKSSWILNSGKPFTALASDPLIAPLLEQIKQRCSAWRELLDEALFSNSDLGERLENYVNATYAEVQRCIHLGFNRKRAESSDVPNGYGRHFSKSIDIPKCKFTNVLRYLLSRFVSPMINIDLWPIRQFWLTIAPDSQHRLSGTG